MEISKGNKVKAIFNSVLDQLNEKDDKAVEGPVGTVQGQQVRATQLSSDYLAKRRANLDKKRKAEGKPVKRHVYAEPENSSTQITYRDGIKALFESVLDEEARIIPFPRKYKSEESPKPTPRPKGIEANIAGTSEKPVMGSILTGEYLAARKARLAAKKSGANKKDLVDNPEPKDYAGHWKPHGADDPERDREDSSHNIRKAFQSILSENDLWRAKRNVHRDVVNAARGDKNALSNLKSHASGRELVNTYHKLHADFKDLNLKRGMSEDEAHMGAHHEASAEVERLVSDHGYHDPSKPFEGMPRAK